jgi:SAM-dependent methyltransferase
MLTRDGSNVFYRLSSAMLEACGDLPVVQQAREDRVSFEDASIDWMTAVCLFHHVGPADRVRLAADMRRALRPGGLFVMIEHNPLNPFAQVIVRRTPVDEHARLLTARAARRLARAAGFDVVATRYFLVIPERFYRWAGAVEGALTRLPLSGQYAVFGVKPHDLTR